MLTEVREREGEMVKEVPVDFRSLLVQLCGLGPGSTFISNSYWNGKRLTIYLVKVVYYV